MNIGMPGARPGDELLSHLTPSEVQSSADNLNGYELIVGIVWRTCSLTADYFSNQCLERIWVKLFDLSQSPSASEPA
jgi:hypothetical protein